VSEPVVLGPGEGVRYEARGSEMFFKALASNTSGRRPGPDPDEERALMSRHGMEPA
jgi:hypothetical protein